MRHNMALSTRPYRGTRDFFPPDKRLQNYLFEAMRTTAEAFGYEPYDGPLLEEVELYKAKSGEELINEQIYSFTDRGGRFVSIRPEMTPTLARMVAQIHKETPKPIRWYAIPNLMRYENPQKGRLREHWQFNCDIFGAPNLRGELEIFQLLIHLFKTLGADQRHFEILVNDRQVVDAILQLLQLSKDQSYKLYKIIDRSKKVKENELDEMLKVLNLSQEHLDLLKHYLKIETFSELFAFLGQYELGNVHDGLYTFYQKLEKLDLLTYVRYDPTIVRGLDYYTGVVFEIFDKHPDNRRALCGGGGYANLLQIFNEAPLPGFGFGLGDVTLKDFLQVHGLLPDFSKPEIDLFLTFQQEEAEDLCLKWAQALRSQNFSVETLLTATKVKKIFPLAERKGAKCVGILGEKEMAENKLTVKDLASGKQDSFSMDQLHELVDLLKAQQK